MLRYEKNIFKHGHRGKLGHLLTGKLVDIKDLTRYWQPTKFWYDYILLHMMTFWPRINSSRLFSRSANLCVGNMMTYKQIVLEDNYCTPYNLWPDNQWSLSTGHSKHTKFQLCRGFYEDICCMDNLWFKDLLIDDVFLELSKSLTFSTKYLAVFCFWRCFHT